MLPTGYLRYMPSIIVCSLTSPRHSSLGLDLPPPLPHALYPLPILLKSLPQHILCLLPLLPVLKPVKVVLDAVILAAFVQLGLLLLSVFEARRACATAAGDGDETVFIGNRPRGLAGAIAQVLESSELGEVGIYGGLESARCGINEGCVRFVA